MLVFQRSLYKGIGVHLKETNSPILLPGLDCELYDNLSSPRNGLASAHHLHYDNIDYYPFVGFMQQGFKAIQGGFTRIADYAQWAKDNNKQLPVTDLRSLQDATDIFFKKSEVSTPYTITLDHVDPVNDIPLIIFNNDAAHGGPMHGVSPITKLTRQAERPLRGLAFFKEWDKVKQHLSQK